jgi:hypothetical protein
VHADIRSWLATNVSPAAAARTRVIYGGSVTSANCAALSAQVGQPRAFPRSVFVTFCAAGHRRFSRRRRVAEACRVPTDNPFKNARLIAPCRDITVLSLK